MTTWTAELKEAKATTTTTTNRSLLGAVKRDTGKILSDPCGEERDKSNMEKRIDMLIKAYNNKGTWKNPMP
jgi:hypothetical protein